VGAATASPVAAPSAAKQLPSTAAAAPKEAPKEAPKSTPVKRAAEAEVVDLVDSDEEEGGGAAAAPSKRARAGAQPLTARTQLAAPDEPLVHRHRAVACFHGQACPFTDHVRKAQEACHQEGCFHAQALLPSTTVRDTRSPACRSTRVLTRWCRSFFK